VPAVTGLDGELRRLALGVLLPGFPGTSPPGRLLDLLADGLAGVVLFERNVTPGPDDAGGPGGPPGPDGPDGGVAALTAALRAARPDLLVGIDEEGGDVTRLDAARGSQVPGAAALGRVDDVDLTRGVARTLGTRLARVGVPLVLAPVADVHSDPDNPVIGIRSFGPDPDLVARHVVATIAGLHDAGVAATAKHFPGHGATREDSHLTVPVVDVDRDVLARRELVPFRAALAAGVDVVMTAHVRYPALDTVPATLSRRAVTDLLRGELGFAGVVMSDGLDMHAITATVGRPDGAVQALAAGVDALCVGGESVAPAQVEELVAAIVAAVQDGRLPEQRLADAAARVAALAAQLARSPAGPASRTGAAGLTAPAGAAGPASPRADLGAQAARRALDVRGHVVLAGPPLVVELHEGASIAAGDVPWAIGAALADRLPGTRVLPLTAAAAGDMPAAAPAAAVAAVLAAAGQSPLLVSARRTRPGTWTRAVLDALAAVRPDLVLVDHGVPDSDVGVARVATWSASRVSAQAAADLLAGSAPGLASSP